MASNYKYFSEHHRVVAVNSLKEEVLQESGSLGWMTQSDAPYYFTQFASGGANFPTSEKVFDITFGRSSETTNNYPNDNFVVEKNIYNQFSKILLGLNNNSYVTFNTGSSQADSALHNAYFVNFCRSQFNDKIAPGTFNLTVNVSGAINIDLKDDGLNFSECASGRYGILYASASNPADVASLNFGINKVPQGLLFYEAGVAVVSPYIFSKYDIFDNPSGSNEYLDVNNAGILVDDAPDMLSGKSIKDLIVTSSIKDHAEALKTRIVSANFYSDTELNSTIYFCRAYNHEFNYSSNPTYLNNSKIVVKNDDPMAPPRAYITTVGLYSDDNQLLAVAKLSEPVLKTPENELIARVRLDW